MLSPGRGHRLRSHLHSIWQPNILYTLESGPSPDDTWLFLWTTFRTIVFTSIVLFILIVMTAPEKMQEIIFVCSPQAGPCRHGLLA